MRRWSAGWWATTFVLASVTGVVVRSTLERSAAVLDRFGSLVSVAVVASPVDAGSVVGDGDVRLERRPASMVPDGRAVTTAARAVGRVAVVPLVPGEVVVASKLAPEGLRGAAALLPAGMRAIAVPAGPGGRPPVVVGDRVDVLATLAPEDEGSGEAPTVVVAEGALVVDVDGESDAVTVAVPAEDAPAVAYAVTAGSITLALTAPAPHR
jgi:pilus assembly protein CpaB